MDAIFVLTFCICLIGFYLAFNTGNLQWQHNREKSKRWQKRMKQFKKRFPLVDTSKPKYKIKRNR